MNDPTFRAIEIIEEQFPKQTKGVVLTVEEPRTKERGYTMAFVAGKFWIYLSLVIGPRGGLKEQLVAYDPTQRVIVDKLFLCTRFGITPHGDYGLLNLEQLRDQVKGLNPSEQEPFISDALLAQAKEAAEKPALFEERILEIHARLVASSSPVLKPIVWERSSLIFLRSSN
ncbi:MAG: hypothetical protein UX89_C0007G0033 [Parcubacteria group bacterium GW2011_GWA2_47_16]|nr:MAG: hypothetical protein UX89_C0007G0033 [Parcubacteria group bacterium GW2011_GWA2_47_16]